MKSRPSIRTYFSHPKSRNKIFWIPICLFQIQHFLQQRSIWSAAGVGHLTSNRIIPLSQLNTCFGGDANIIKLEACLVYLSAKMQIPFNRYQIKHFLSTLKVTPVLISLQYPLHCLKLWLFWYQRSHFETQNKVKSSSKYSNDRDWMDMAKNSDIENSLNREWPTQLILLEHCD